MTSYPDFLEERIDYLPLLKHRKLALITKILFEEFQQAQSTKTKKLNCYATAVF